MRVKHKAFRYCLKNFWIVFLKLNLIILLVTNHFLRVDLSLTILFKEFKKFIISENLFFLSRNFEPFMITIILILVLSVPEVMSAIFTLNLNKKVLKIYQKVKN
jgi:hypothetical protein